jgi:hypothetical protein
LFLSQLYRYRFFRFRVEISREAGEPASFMRVKVPIPLWAALYTQVLFRLPLRVSEASRRVIEIESPT